MRDTSNVPVEKRKRSKRPFYSRSLSALHLLSQKTKAHTKATQAILRVLSEKKGTVAGMTEKISPLSWLEH
jgi:hypothetical protein